MPALSLTQWPCFLNLTNISSDCGRFDSFPEIFYCLDLTLYVSAVRKVSPVAEKFRYSVLPSVLGSSNAHHNTCHIVDGRYPGKMDELTVEGLNLIIHDTATYSTLLNAHISTDLLPSLTSPHLPYLVFVIS